jgi:AraC-like DNA-binding protein
MNQQYVPFLKNVGVQSADFDEARQFINSRIDDREVLPMSAGSDTENILTWQPLDGSTLFGARWSEKVHIQSEPQTTFHAILVLSGCIHCKTTKRDITAGGLLLIAPGQQADLVWEKSTRSVVINLSRQALVDHLGVPCLEMLGKTSTALSPTDKDAQLIRQGIECIAKQHEICDGNLDPFLQKQWQSLLLTHFSDQITKATRINPTVLPAKIRLATEWIHANIHNPISVCDLLKVTQTSRRSLESCFRSFLNTTPAKYILCHKLKGVRDLLRSDKEISIGDAAFAFGFQHQSHFTRQYQEAFGELPSETVRQQRGTRYL